MLASLFGIGSIDCDHLTYVYRRCEYGNCGVVRCSDCMQVCPNTETTTSPEYFCEAHIEHHRFPCGRCQALCCPASTREYLGEPVCFKCYQAAHQHPSALFKSSECCICGTRRDVHSCHTCGMRACTNCLRPCERYWDTDPASSRKCSAECAGKRCVAKYCYLCYAKQRPDETYAF